MYALKARDKLHKREKDDYKERRGGDAGDRGRGRPREQRRQPSTARREAKVCVCVCVCVWAVTWVDSVYIQ